MKLLFLILITLSLQTFASDEFQQACHVIGEDDYVLFAIEKSGTKFKLKLIAFEDENCKTPYLQYDQLFRITSLQDQNLNLETVKISYTTLTHETTDALNMINYCGSNDWLANEEKTVTGKKCDDFQQLAEKEILYQIFKTGENKIWLGEITHDLSGRTEKVRPTQFDLEFTKIFAKPSLHINRIPLK